MTSPNSRRPVPAVEYLSLFDEGVRVLDVRGGPDWAQSHLRGSVFIGLTGHFQQWVELLLDPSLPWLVLADPGQEQIAIECLEQLGYQDLRGFLEGGFGALLAHPDRLTSTERVDHMGLAAELEGTEPPYLLDVRQPQEWQAGRIGDAPNIPLTEFEKRCAEIPGDRRVILQCQGGYRSLIAASLLELSGAVNTIDMAGGFGAWANAGRPISFV